MLEEKAYYDFRVVRLIDLPDGSRNWVLTLNGDDRYMIPHAKYLDYGIETGCVLHCRVDKINCTGRIFLEPVHPLYKEGETCSFIFSHEDTRSDKAGNVMRILYLKDKKGGIHDCMSFSDEYFSEGDKVKVKVVMIRKGRLVLDHIINDSPEHPAEGQKYTFVILQREGHHSDGSLYVSGPMGIRSILKSEDYPFLDQRPGSTFRAELVKWQYDCLPVVEPEHPFYNPGKAYTFRVLRIDNIKTDDGIDGGIIVVSDDYGNEIKVFPGELVKDYDNLPEEVHCMVLRLKKGRPVLRLVR